MVLPVQLGPLDGVELFFLFVLAGIVAGIWVYHDASKRGDENALLWAAVVAFLFLFYFVVGFAALVIYVVLRGRSEPDPSAERSGEEPNGRERTDGDRVTQERSASEKSGLEEAAGTPLASDRSTGESSTSDDPTAESKE